MPFPDNDLYTPRVIKPRRRRYKRLPVVALDWNPVGEWLAETGEIGSMENMIAELNKMPPTLFTLSGAADFLATLDEYWQVHDPAHWQWRATENERAIRTPGAKVTASRVTAVIHYFGFKGGNYHKLIDPVTMYGHKLDDIWPGEEPAQLRLLAWAVALRDFCDRNSMEVRPTIGSLAAQFWTDRRFYPDERRKVPQATNATSREHLPGNHYALLTEPSPHQEFTAHYIDQTQAHHYHARTTALPHPDSLYAYGCFRDLTTRESVWDTVPPNFHGLLCVHLQAPPEQGPLHWVRASATHHFIFTNELSHLIDLGYVVDAIFAAWGSFARDTGVARYATFAQKQLDRYENAAWIKPILLAAYGTLATRAGYGETIFRLAKRGTPVEIRTGRRILSGILTRRPVKLEPGIANVIHRGMIEAACRSESIGLAQWLTHLGHTVLSIYADAVIVEQDADLTLPPLPDPWRIKQTLTHLQFINQQAFISGEMTKLPGVSKDFLRYRQRAPGHAPRKTMYEAVTGRPIRTDRRI